MKRFLLLALLLMGTTLHAADLPYDTTADANAQVQQALALAKQNHKPVLLFFGANWCEDCRSLAASLSEPKNAELIKRDFNVVKIDVGQFDHNLELASSYGNPIKKGIPAAVIVSPQGQLLYSTKAGELSNARRMSSDGVHDFFQDKLNKLKS
ncbi:MAG: thioredoxin family protein [Dyella sp.]